MRGSAFSLLLGLSQVINDIWTTEAINGAIVPVPLGGERLRLLEIGR